MISWKFQKKINHNLPIGRVERDVFDPGGFTFRFCMGFWLDLIIKVPLWWCCIKEWTHDTLFHQCSWWHKQNWALPHHWSPQWLKCSTLTKCPVLHAIMSLCCNYQTTCIWGLKSIEIVPMYVVKMSAKYWDVVSTWSGPLGLRMGWWTRALPPNKTSHLSSVLLYLVISKLN